MDAIKIGIIGCGAAAKRYYVSAFKRYPHLVKNLHLVDKNTRQAEELARELGGGEIFNDHGDVVEKVDGAIVAVPHFLHYQIAIDFLNAGVSVLCEKPLAESAQEVREMNEAAARNNATLCVNNTRRMFPSFQMVRDIIAEGQIGQLKTIKYYEGNTFAWPSSTGFYVDPRVSSKGVLLDLGPHVLDTVCWWLGAKPELIEYKDDSFGGPESVARIKALANGCSIEIFLNRLVDLDNRFEIVGELGTIEGKIFDWHNISVIFNSGETQQKKSKKMFKTYPEFIRPVIDNFIGVIAGTEKPLVSGNDVEASIQFIEGCYANRSRFQLPWYKNWVESPGTGTEGATLITGATGFIGGRIVEALHLSKRRKVRAAVRQWSTAARLGRFPVDIVKMDLMNKEEIADALDGVTEIVHCAKGTEDVTVQGTRNLLEIALKKGIKRFVHLSTSEVYGNVTGEVHEDSPFQYTGNAYNKMKIDAEKECWHFEEQGVPLVILRPSIVYGPFSKNWTIHFANLFLEGKWGIYEKYGDGICNLIHIDDLVRAVFLALDHKDALGHAFNVVGPEVITWNQYFTNFNAALGLPPLKIINTTQANLQTTLMEPVRFLGRIVKTHFLGPVKKVAETFPFAKRMLKITEFALKTTPSPDELKLFSKDILFSTTKAKDLLQFQPSISVDEGLKITVKWLEHQGFH